MFKSTMIETVWFMNSRSSISQSLVRLHIYLDTVYLISVQKAGSLNMAIVRCVNNGIEENGSSGNVTILSQSTLSAPF